MPWNLFDTTPSVATVVLLGALALGASACGSISITSTDGSGIAETTVLSLDDVERVDISDTFDATITVGEGPTSVEITVDDNFVDDLEAEVDDGELKIGFRSGSRSFEVPPTATIRVGDLDELDVSGASSVAVIDLDTDDFVLDISGASDVDIDGTADTLTIDVSGASSADLTGLDATGADVDISGASSANLGSVSSIEGDVDGASSLTGPASASADLDITGASSFDQD